MLIMFFLLLLILGFSWLIPPPSPVTLEFPTTWPDPVYDFEKNPLTKEGIYLGRHLFYDPILSRDTSVSCSSCHLSYTAFTHVDHGLSHGIDDNIGNRNAPALTNLAWSTSFMWDGAVHYLDQQALGPIHDPNEMGDDLKNVIAKLQSGAKYPPLFQAAFGDSLISGETFLKALSQFQLSLITAGSKYDQVKAGKEGFMFSGQEEKGYTVFKRHCDACHTEPLFTSFAFSTNGLPIDTSLNDYGRFAVTQNPLDSFLFKIPSLRNIEYSFPYMHDGRFKKIKQVLEHYEKGVHAYSNLPTALRKGIVLTPYEKVELISFLFTLSDPDFLRNKDHAFPRE